MILNKKINFRSVINLNANAFRLIQLHIELARGFFSASYIMICPMTGDKTCHCSIKGTFRMLFSDHMVYDRLVTGSILDGLDDSSLYVARLEKNQKNQVRNHQNDQANIVQKKDRH